MWLLKHVKTFMLPQTTIREIQNTDTIPIYPIRVISQYVSNMELQQNDLVYILLANLTKTLT